MRNLIIVIFCSLSLRFVAQVQMQGTNLGETTTAIRALSIGSVSVDSDIDARLHINNFFCNTPGGGLNGFLFRSDGDQEVDNRWQLFTGSSSTSQTERFRIRTLAGGYNTYLERTEPGNEADIRLLTAEIEIRGRNKRLGDFCEVRSEEHTSEL